MHQLYTWGDTATQPGDLRAYVVALDGVVLDVRFAAWSRHPQWRCPARPPRLSHRREHGRRAKPS
jgi:hypothetical protein